MQEMNRMDNTICEKKTNGVVSGSGDTIDVVTIGETVMDLISADLVDSVEEATIFHRYLGGSPTNIAMNIAQLGLKSALISRVGSDVFGSYAQKMLAEKGVNLAPLQIDPVHKTTVIFVARSIQTPEVIHYRGADRYLVLTEEAKDCIRRAQVVHFSGFALSQSPCRDVLQELKSYALQLGKMITMDPCFHEPLWENPAEGRQIFMEFIRNFDLIKPSFDDLTRLWGGVTPEEGIQRFHELGARQVLLTMGKEGVLVSDGKRVWHREATQVVVKDATGAGDSFWSGVLAKLLTGGTLDQAVTMGMLTAATTLQHVGAIAPLPRLAELEKRLGEERV